MANGSTRVVYAALAGNALVAVAKYIAAALSGSSAMLTEAIHSTSDCTNQALLLIGVRRQKLSRRNGSVRPNAPTGKDATVGGAGCPVLASLPAHSATSTAHPRSFAWRCCCT